jgi:hypothetical protein
MALRFMDGFDHCGPREGPNDSAALATKYETTNSLFLNPWFTRTGVGAVRFVNGGSSSGNHAITKVLPASGGAIVGAAFRTTTIQIGAVLFQVREGTTVHIELSVGSGGTLIVKRGATTLATSSSPAIVTASWQYVELKTVIHDTTGTYEVRVDGVAVPGLTASGVDTNNAGATGQWDRILLGGSGGESAVDDVYVCDTSGSTNNDFLGPVKVETLLPQTGNGTNLGLTPSTGTDHGALVDENPPNITDYNSSATVGAKDTYHYPSLSLTGAILGIQTNLYVAKSDAATRQVCAVVRASGTDYDGANVAPSTTFGYFSEVRAVNPATGVAWTAADLAALEAGMKVTA